jgi:hypothetical protein
MNPSCLKSFPGVRRCWRAWCKAYESQGFIKKLKGLANKVLSFQRSFDSLLWLTYNLTESQPISRRECFL